MSTTEQIIDPVLIWLTITIHRHAMENWKVLSDNSRSHGSLESSKSSTWSEIAEGCRLFTKNSSSKSNRLFLKQYWDGLVWSEDTRKIIWWTETEDGGYSVTVAARDRLCFCNRVADPMSQSSVGSRRSCVKYREPNKMLRLLFKGTKTVLYDRFNKTSITKVKIDGLSS